MSLHNFPIIEILNKIASIGLSRNETNLLIKKCFSLALSFLRSKFKSQIKIISNDEYMLEDIAMDAIIPLFIEMKNKKIGIERSIEKWNEEINTEAEAEYFLSRIVWRRVDQTVTKLLKENDPIFEKILKTLKVCILNNSYKKIRYFGTVYILKDKIEKSEKSFINESHFNIIPENYFGLKQTDLFENIFKYLQNHTDFFPAIPLNLLVKRVKNYHSQKYKLPHYTNSNSEEILTVSTIVEKELNEIKQKLDVFYVSKNKLNEDDADFIYLAFNNISKDMLNGGMHESLYTYLKDQNSSLTKELFYLKYHRIMNYLLSRFKENLAENIYSNYF